MSIGSSCKAMSCLCCNYITNVEASIGDVKASIGDVEASIGEH